MAKTKFAPRHKSKLSNNFASFTNYDPALLDDIVNEVQNWKKEEKHTITYKKKKTEFVFTEDGHGYVFTEDGHDKMVMTKNW